MGEYLVAHLDEIGELDDGRCRYRPVRHQLGITAFGINAWTGRETGDRIINEHDEDEPGGNEELYLVTEGRATFELDHEQVEASAGTFVFVRAGVKRTAFAAEAGTTIVAVGGTPGEPYVPVGWEIWSPLRKLYDEGRYAEAADHGRGLAESHPQYPELFYNLACCESLAGRTTSAIDHLTHAIELSDRCRVYAQSDSDFDPIRNEPGFPQLDD